METEQLSVYPIPSKRRNLRGQYLNLSRRMSCKNHLLSSQKQEREARESIFITGELLASPSFIIFAKHVKRFVGLHQYQSQVKKNSASGHCGTEPNSKSRGIDTTST